MESTTKQEAIMTTTTPRNRRETAELVARTFEEAFAQVQSCLKHGQTLEQALHTLEQRAMSTRMLAR